MCLKHVQSPRRINFWVYPFFKMNSEEVPDAGVLSNPPVSVKEDNVVERETRSETFPFK